MIKRLLLSAIIFCSVLYSFGQETTSQILGTVTDGTTALSGATVTALHVPTGTKYTTTTRKDGRFNLPNVRVGGPYLLTVSYVGFKEEKTENITLVVGQDYVADVKMIAEAKELSAVSVSAGRQNKMFNNNRTGAQEIITRQQIERLPTISRSIQDFAKLEPTSNGLSFAGTNPGLNNITVDGADFNNSFGLSSTLGGQANAQPIALDAIDQIQVNVAPYDVRQGGFTGAGVNSVTRSGTNQLRATVYDYIKGPGTIGYKVENSRVPKTPFNYNIVGASIGGAIIKNRLFFFINGEQNKQSAPATGILASDASHPPQSGVYSQANADSLTMIKNFVKGLGYDPGSFAPSTFQTNSYKVNARLDLNINQYNTLTLKYNYLKSYADQFASSSRPGSGQVTGGQPGNTSVPFSDAGYRINNNLNIWIAELNTRFGNSASNKFQIGYTRERDFRTPAASSAFPHVDILTSGNITTSFGYEMYTYSNTLNMDSYQLTDIFTVYKGGHEITIGTQDSYKKYQNAFAPGWNGVYQFNSITDFLTGKPAATYYQQYSTLKGAAFPWAYAGATNLSFFAQDKWRASPNFTLTYGVRFDYTTYQNKFTDNPNFDALTFKNNATYNVGKAPNGFLVVSPRVGFNWDITGDRTWQLRGGAGIFEGAPPFVWVENQAANNGVQFGSFTQKNMPFFADPSKALNYYLNTINTPPLAQTSTPPGYSVNVVDKSFKYPTKLRTSVGLDKKLPNDWVVTGEFTYSKDINATYMYNANLKETNAFSISNGGDNRLRYNTTGNSTSGTNNSNKYYNGTTLTNPNIGNAIILANTSKGWSYAATARVLKNWHNLQASVAYTYSDTRTTMENGSTASSLWSARAVANTDPNAPTLARPSWYQPHRIIAQASYRIDEGKHTATFIGAVYEAVAPGATSYTYNGDLNGDGNTGNDLIYVPRNQQDINLIPVNSGTANLSNATLDHSDTRTASQIWNQLNAFISQDHYLNLRRGQYTQANSVTYPWIKHLDLNFTQDIYFYTKRGGESDKHTLRLSMDIVNVGNLLNRYWGIQKSPVQTQFLKFEGMAANSQTPQFSFPYSDATNKVPYTTSWNNNTALTNFANGQTFYGSRWQIQFGIRYMFN